MRYREPLRLPISKGVSRRATGLLWLRSADEISGDPELPDEFAAGAISLVPVELLGRAVRINVTIDEGLLARIDQAAAREGETRSGFVHPAAAPALGELRGRVCTQSTGIA